MIFDLNKTQIMLLVTAIYNELNDIDKKLFSNNKDIIKYSSWKAQEKEYQNLLGILKNEK